MPNIQSYIILISSIFLSVLGSAFSCSSLSVNYQTKRRNNNCIVARTGDTTIETGNQIGIGRKGQSNTSNIDLNKVPLKEHLRWKNKYNYLGKTMTYNSPIITDGINSAGLYITDTSLPNFTKYSKYNKNTKKYALGVMDIPNYLLATANSVDTAIQELRKTQIVENTIAVTHYPVAAPYLGIKHNSNFNVILPLHYILRDASGHSAVIEFINGKVRIYKHIGSVITNDPQYSELTSLNRKFKHLSIENLTHTVYGMNLDGSGFYGAPGDWTSPSRYIRATAILKHAPAAHNDTQAIAILNGALQSVTVPIGTNPMATIWVSIANLNSGTYYFKRLYKVDFRPSKDGLNNTVIYKPLPSFNNSWQTYHLKSIVNTDKKVNLCNASNYNTPCFTNTAVKQTSYPLTYNLMKSSAHPHAQAKWHLKIQ